VVKQLKNLKPFSKKNIQQTLFYPAYVISQILGIELVTPLKLNN
jgi:hypothetical protein